MKIGIFDPYLDDLGGGERYMMTIAKCLARDNEVSVFWEKREDLENIEKRFSLDLSKVKLTKNIFDGKASFFKKIKNSMGYDIIIFLSDGSIPFLLSKKVLLHIQQPITAVYPSAKDKIKLRRISKIFCNSRYTKKFVDSVYAVQSELLYPPVSIYGIPEKKENVILHVGRFRIMNVKAKDYKKQRFMIDAFKQMVDDGLKDWEFVLGVSLPDEKDENFLKMRERAKGYPVKFLINADKDELWRLGSKAKIYWHASGFGEDLDKYPELAEHFGISTVEAMGIGAVPVVINAGGQIEIVEDGKNGFLWNSLEEFKAKTLKLVNNSKLLESMSKKAYLRSLEFSDDSFCQKIKVLVK